MGWERIQHDTVTQRSAMKTKKIELANPTNLNPIYNGLIRSSNLIKNFFLTIPLISYNKVHKLTTHSESDPCSGGNKTSLCRGEGVWGVKQASYRKARKEILI